MLTKFKLALLIAAPLAGTATYAMAGGDAPGQEPAKDIVQKSDAKRAEHHKEMLAKWDANKDGKLDDAERKAMVDARLTERFQAMDKNGDGKLTLDEFKAGAAKGHRHGRFHHGRTHGAGMKP